MVWRASFDANRVIASNQDAGWSFNGISEKAIFGLDNSGQRVSHHDGNHSFFFSFMTTSILVARLMTIVNDIKAETRGAGTAYYHGT